MSHALTRLGFALLLASLASVSARAEPPKLPVPAYDQSAVALRGYFYVGGKYVGEPGKEIMEGQIYVEVIAPKAVKRIKPAATPSKADHGARSAPRSQNRIS